MTTQINLRMNDDFLELAKNYAKTHGYLNVQEFIREAAREKIYDNAQVRQEYLEILNSKEANTFLNNDESIDFENELKMRAKLE